MYFRAQKHAGTLYAFKEHNAPDKLVPNPAVVAGSIVKSNLLVKKRREISVLNVIFQ